jgi:hypothetical protein
MIKTYCFNREFALALTCNRPNLFVKACLDHEVFITRDAVVNLVGQPNQLSKMDRRYLFRTKDNDR